MRERGRKGGDWERERKARIKINFKGSLSIEEKREGEREGEREEEREAEREGKIEGEREGEGSVVRGG